MSVLCGVRDCLNTSVGWTEVKHAYTAVGSGSLLIEICNTCSNKLRTADVPKPRHTCCDSLVADGHLTNCELGKTFGPLK